MSARRLIPLAAALLAALAFAAPASAVEFTNDDGAVTAVNAGNATPYPSNSHVGGMNGPITDVNVRLDSFDADVANDADILLISPDGQGVVLMSDACGGGMLRENLTFDHGRDRGSARDGATCGGGASFRPADYDATEVWPGDGLAEHRPRRLQRRQPQRHVAALRRRRRGQQRRSTSPPGSLDIQVAGAAIQIPVNESFRPAEPYPLETLVDSTDTVITDLNVLLDGVAHEKADQMDIFLEGPRASRCG